MTILCLVRDKIEGTWAAFSDCLITSDEHDEGIALHTPNRLFQDERTTHGFAEVRLEEKLGLLGDNCLFGWENSRHEASALVREIKSIGTKSFDFDTLAGRKLKNSYLIVTEDQSWPGSKIRLISNKERSEFFDGDRFTVHASGSGRGLIDRLKFTSAGGGISALGIGGDVADAALKLMVKYLSEELGGSRSQFYSLRTGGWFSMFLPAPDGIYQYRFCFNHWSMGLNGEPLVSHIVIPWQQDGINFALTFLVNDDWKLEYRSAIAILPLLDLQRNVHITISPADVILNYKADSTFHYCWNSESHKCFAVPLAEPHFRADGEFLHKLPHSEVTISNVRRLLAEP